MSTPAAEPDTQTIGPFGHDEVVAGFADLADRLNSPEAEGLSEGDWQTLALLTITADTIIRDAAPPEAGDVAMAMPRPKARRVAVAMGMARPPYRRSHV